MRGHMGIRHTSYAMSIPTRQIMLQCTALSQSDRGLAFFLPSQALYQSPELSDGLNMNEIAFDCFGPIVTV
jgi:hypothetical protein